LQTQYSFQPDFRPDLTPVNACANYARYREELETIDDILRRSGLDGIMVDLALQKRRESIPEEQERRCDLNKFLHHCLVAWRLRLLVPLLDSRAVRDVEKNLADSSLHQWFCHIGNFGLITSPGKSTIDRYKNWYDRDQLRGAFSMLLQKAAADETHYDVVLEEAVNILGFEMPSDLSEAWFDSTCLKPNIHFPVDWVLLTDVVRTLMKAVEIIRKHGLKNRMPADGPATFLKRINQLSINMANSRRQKDGRKMRKAILREIKKLTKTVEKHARTHCELLENNRMDSDLSEAQAAVVISRIKGVIEKIPQAIEQAHERIIGERRVAPAKKLLSLYEPETKVIVRGKSGAEVEFGNKLMLGENREGLITCWELYDEVHNDDKLLEDVLGQTSANTGMPVRLMCGDRGFGNKDAQRALAREEPARKDHVASKSVVDFTEQMEDCDFRESQQRRAQTEGRVGIIKNVFMSGRSLSKGLDSRRQELSWIMLSHNLRVLACKRIAEKQARESRREALAKAG
jgi:hypothetical protein